MKKPFIHDDFLLENKYAVELYHRYAENQPIIDYHCHLQPAQIANNQRFAHMTDIWLSGDHYKWRAMRSNGIPEQLCTGNAPPRDKFQAWAETMPRLLGNPLYHWTHLELARYFGIANKLLSPDTANYIWNKGNQQLAKPNFTARSLMQRSRVQLACTTDDPTDSLEHHIALASDTSFPIRVLPTWRPDKAMTIENPTAFNAWTDKLAALTNTDIRHFDSFLHALRIRHAFFHEQGCRLSDHGIEAPCATDYSDREIASIFKLVRAARKPSPIQILQFKSAMLFEFGVMDAERDWTQQFHMGILRNNNSALFQQVGPDSGFDSIGDFEIARPLARLLDRLHSAGRLARTILYNSNPRDNELLATMIGNFQDASTPGKMQLGSGWWFLDQKDGMERHLEALSQLGLLSRFVGMLTDSRSFLSYTRHEYFRRILCNKLGRNIASGILPADTRLVGNLVSDVCYNNAARYFGFNLPTH